MTKYNTSNKDDVIIYKVDIDKEPSLVKRFNIKGVPVLVYIKNGKIVKQEHGVKNLQDIQANVINYF